MLLVDFLFGLGISFPFLLSRLPYLQRNNRFVLALGHDDFFLGGLLDNMELVPLAINLFGGMSAIGDSTCIYWIVQNVLDEGHSE